MSLESVKDKENNKFNSRGEVRVSSSGGGLIGDIVFDDAQVVIMTSLIDNVNYYLAATLIATVELTYSDTTKNNVIRSRRI